MKKNIIIPLVLAACCLLAGCGQPSSDENTSAPLPSSIILLPEASGIMVEAGGGAEIDYSNVQDGYVMARFPGENSQRLRVQVAGPNSSDDPYTYDLPTGNTWSTFPLSDGNGSYRVTVLQNTEGNKYALLAAASFDVTLTDEFAPFLRPNQYVDYSDAEQTVQMAAELSRGLEQPLEKVAAVYDYVVTNLSYDYELAEAIISGQLTAYLPDLDSVLAAKSGICLDYAALMTGMLRSQGIPCKLAVGFAGDVYHAWVSVWTEETGWVDNAIFFDGTTWHRMDPTFASSGSGSETVSQFIKDESNYTVKFLY